MHPDSCLPDSVCLHGEGAALHSRKWRDTCLPLGCCLRQLGSQQAWPMHLPAGAAPFSLLLCWRLASSPVQQPPHCLACSAASHVHTYLLWPPPTLFEAAQCRHSPVLRLVLQAGDLMAATDKFWITFSGMPVQFAITEHNSSDSQDPAACNSTVTVTLHACLQALLGTFFQGALKSDATPPNSIARCLAPCSREGCCWVHALPAAAAPGSRKEPT